MKTFPVISDNFQNTQFTGHVRWGIWISVKVSRFCRYNNTCFLWLPTGWESRYQEQKDAETWDNVNITRQMFGKTADVAYKNLKCENSRKFKFVHKCENKFPLNGKLFCQIWKDVKNVNCYTVTNKKLLAYIFSVYYHKCETFSHL